MQLHKRAEIIIASFIRSHSVTSSDACTFMDHLGVPCALLWNRRRRNFRFYLLFQLHNVGLIGFTFITHIFQFYRFFLCLHTFYTMGLYMCIDPLFIQKGWLNFTFNRVGFIHLGYRVFSLFKLPSTITMLHCVDNYNSRRISCVHNNVSRCIECIGKNHQFGTRCASVLKVCRAETEPSLM